MNKSKCLKCGEQRLPKDIECPYCGIVYEKAEAVALHAKINPHFDSENSPKKFRTIMNCSIYLFIAYMVTALLLAIKKPYINEFDGAIFYTLKYISLPIMGLSIWVACKASPSISGIFIFIFISLTFGLLLATPSYVSNINYYIGEQQTIKVKGHIVSKFTTGGRSHSYVIEISSPQLPSTVKFRVNKIYYQKVNVGSNYKRTLKKGSLGIYYVERKRSKGK